MPLLPVFVCVACGNTFYGVLKTRPLALLGTVSFSIYMIHMVIVYMLIHAFDRFVFQIGSADDLQRWMLSLGCALVAVLCALLTYRYIEHPFIANAAARVRHTDRYRPSASVARSRRDLPTAQNRYEIPICNTGYHR